MPALPANRAVHGLVVPFQELGVTGLFPGFEKLLSGRFVVGSRNGEDDADECGNGDYGGYWDDEPKALIERLLGGRLGSAVFKRHVLCLSYVSRQTASR